MIRSPIYFLVVYSSRRSSEPSDMPNNTQHNLKTQQALWSIESYTIVKTYAVLKQQQKHVNAQMVIVPRRKKYMNFWKVLHHKFTLSLSCRWRLTFDKNNHIALVNVLSPTEEMHHLFKKKMANGLMVRYTDVQVRTKSTPKNKNV